MYKRWTPVLLAGAVWGLAPGANATEQPLSYAADNQCFCNLAVSNPLANRMVGTPIGGQSVAQVCQRIGAGPKLLESDTGYNFPVYQDAQCGHGPSLSSQLSATDEAAIGPKWDLATAYGAPAKKATNTANASEPESASRPGNTTSNRFKPRYVNLPEGSDNTVQPSQTTSTAIRLKPSIKKPVVSTPVVDAASSASSKSNAAIDVPKTPIIKPAIKPAIQPVVEAAKVKPDVTVQKVVEVTKEIKPKVTKPTLKAAQVTTPEVAERAKLSELPELAQSRVEPKAPVRLPIPKTIEEANEVFPQNTATTPNAANAANAVVVEEVTKAPQPLSTAPSTAIQTPSGLDASVANPQYLSVIPMTYDFGGSGVRFTASALRTNNLGVTLKASVAESYQEGSAGVKYLLNAGRTDRLALSLAGGVEYGRFKLAGRGVETTVADLGVFASASALFAVTPRLHVQAGLGISSFFDGDPHVMGSAFFSLTPQWDIAGEFELGDNDSVGLGVRYYY